MQTIKTAVVVVMLLAVLYGAYVSLNGSDTPLPPELAELEKMGLDLELDSMSSPMGNSNMSFPAHSHTSDESQNSAPMFSSSPFTPPTRLNASNQATPSRTGNEATSSIQPSLQPEFSLLPPKGLTNSNNATLSNNSGSPAGLSFPQGSSSTAKSTASPMGLNSQVGNALSTDELLDTAMPLPPKSIADTFRSNSKLNSDSLKVANGSEALPAPPSLSPSNRQTTSSSSVESFADPKASLPNSMTSRSFINAKKVALEQIGRGEYREALGSLSLFCTSPELSSEQRQDLLDILDPLAGEVIYSRRPLLDIPPYVVGNGETIEEIAKKFDVPAEILAKINLIDSPVQLTPATKLKVFRGPFRAEVDLARNEIWMFLGDLYAGRFPIETGNDPMPRDGIFQVIEKSRDHNYYSTNMQIDARDPKNPYGGYWMDLGNNLSIHGSPVQATPGAKGLGCISLSPNDAVDVFAMLSRGSQVQIRR